ncbi:hypothetical protein [Achromobacter pulmonis]|uniref:hypothetical protein n=1 Tax=Achromobacter pulmonis TaxID=1389932 RepID=UPI001F17C0B0|nr:hypothetical protein [Achromobacter pulmonis]MCF7770959.1 hypothetical protein [Achromobacter pulmonis]
MSMKFGRAYCEELGALLSPYRARELYTDEEGEHCGKQFTFGCEDPDCRTRLTPVGIYMVRKSKRAMHFRTKEDHKAGCAFLTPVDGSKVRKPSEREDDYKPTDFPTELDLTPRKRKGNGGLGPGEGADDERTGGGSSRGHGGAGAKRKTNSCTRYLDLVVDCFLCGDEGGMNGNLTIAGKTKPFGRFFKKVRYFGDEIGLIYYGPIDGLKIYNGKGVGLRFADSVWVERRPYRIWVHVSQEVIDDSRRKKSFMTEMAELKKAVDAKEEVVAFFVGAYPARTTVEIKGGATFDLYRAELSSINHLSLAFAKS